jgi:hypothetical protein
MPLRRSQLLYLATVAGSLLAIVASIRAGGVAREAVLVVSAFLLMIGGPIAILCWFGSLTDLEEKKRARHRQLKKEKLEARLWEHTLRELQTQSGAESCRAPPGSRPSSSARSIEPRKANASVAPASGSRASNDSAIGRMPALFTTVASTIGLMGCFQTVDPAVWPMVHPGMPAPELVALAGAPQQIKTNGPKEVWQYCDDFLRRRADYYVAVFMDNDHVVSVHPLPVYSYSGCEDFYRTTY